jgi:DNA-binding NarL/FixJ family response regulator
MSSIVQPRRHVDASSISPGPAFRSRFDGRVRMSTDPVRVCVVDDHPISRLGIVRALETAPDIAVTGTFAAWSDLPGDHRADVLVLDLFLADDVPCLDLVAQLSRSCAVLVTSASRRGSDIEACCLSGARGYLHKGSAPEVFVDAVRTVHLGGTAFPHYAPVVPAPQPGPHGISPRERQVLTYIAAGYTHDQIAARLGISRNTVDTHAKRLRAKLGARNKAHLTRLALVESGLVVGEGGPR